MLDALLPGLLEQLKDTVLAQHRHKTAEERQGVSTYRGPDTFQRCLASRQLSWLCLQLQPPVLDERMGLLLPLILAVTDDPSPSVQQYGHAALAWLGALEGKDGRSGTYHRLLQELITEVERNAHKPQQRLIFMACLAQLLPRLGLYCVRHFSSLMPLLLEWTHAFNIGSAVVAVQVLGSLARFTWPRMPAHADIILQHMQQVSKATTCPEGALRAHIWQARAAGVLTSEGSLGDHDSSDLLIAAVREVEQLLQLCVHRRQGYPCMMLEILHYQQVQGALGTSQGIELELVCSTCPRTSTVIEDPE
eukprot:gene10038-10194_t